MFRMRIAARSTIPLASRAGRSQALHVTRAAWVPSSAMQPLALHEITLDCPEPRDLAEFYRGLLGWSYAAGHEDADFEDGNWLVLLPRSRSVGCC